MFTFLMSYMTQNTKRKQTLESAQYGVEIILKEQWFWHLYTVGILTIDIAQHLGI